MVQTPIFVTVARPDPAFEALIAAFGVGSGRLSTAHLSLAGPWTCNMLWDTTTQGQHPASA
jgi:hypothetical protein